MCTNGVQREGAHGVLGWLERKEEGNDGVCSKRELEEQGWFSGLLR